MHVLVTGANGFIGTHLCRALLATGVDGSPVDRVTAMDLATDLLPRDERLTVLSGSYADAAQLERALATPVDLVFHLASVPSGLCEREPELGMEANVQGMIRLLEAFFVVSVGLSLFVSMPLVGLSASRIGRRMLRACWLSDSM